MFQTNRIATLLLFVGLSANADGSDAKGNETAIVMAYKTTTDDSVKKFLCRNEAMMRILQRNGNARESNSGALKKNCVFCHTDSAKTSF
ncbi:hypothetical protein [Leptospira yasudae]|uniref:Cytochrome C n=1 Tax=Leptospira yasudae TaxID=2202201 RepID=A0A6N4QUD3_9LEPT|nr:hypothetical protein [Leptospira yasudae]TGL75867.1 hypothetical protein EHQ72_15225 [Leptospira yasudae]TGL81606.1 hypothetical protein EHQ77_05875 [Leptospira yasudae]TGL88466.1 hypothetical protein EHQ83_03240 [Leptospira yasudae]